MKLIFTDHYDIEDPFGKLQFGCNTLTYVDKAKGLPPIRVRCIVQQPDESYMVYGATGRMNAPVNIYRARTVDGVHFEQSARGLATGPGTWRTEFDIAYDEDNRRLMAYLWQEYKDSFSLWAYGSDDGGKNWNQLSDKPLYINHDAFSVLWDPRTKQFICYNNTYQPWDRIVPDNIGDRIRRVLSIRTSTDGLDWKPNDDVYQSGPYTPPEELITPDEHDAPDIEFYRFNVFPYADRYVGMMLNYAASPQEANPRHPWTKHGQHCYSEWWVSRDGLDWDRPFRDVFASGEAPSIIEHPPMLVDGRYLWIIDECVFTLPEDRLFYVGARSNGAFSTKPFEMPAEPLMLDAAMQFTPHGPGMFEQSYIMAELVDTDHNVIPGFERAKCVHYHLPANRIRLHWGDEDGYRLAGRPVRLRLYFRDARIYAVTTARYPGIERNEVFRQGI